MDTHRLRRSPDVRPGIRAHARGVAERDDRTSLHAEELDGETAIRRSERRMEEEEREMERAMQAFEKDEERAVARIKEQWRREHWGRDLERRPQLPSRDANETGERGVGPRRRRPR